MVGGNNSADGDDTIIDGAGTALIFGNGGNDTISSDAGNDTAIGGFGNDFVLDGNGTGNNLIFLNEGNDSYVGAGQDGTNRSSIGFDQAGQPPGVPCVLTYSE